MIHNNENSSNNNNEHPILPLRVGWSTLRPPRALCGNGLHGHPSQWLNRHMALQTMPECLPLHLACFLELLAARERLGTRWSKCPFGRCRSFSGESSSHATGPCHTRRPRTPAHARARARAPSRNPDKDRAAAEAHA